MLPMALSTSDICGPMVEMYACECKPFPCVDKQTSLPSGVDARLPASCMCLSKPSHRTSLHEQNSKHNATNSRRIRLNGRNTVLSPQRWPIGSNDIPQRSRPEMPENRPTSHILTPVRNATSYSKHRT